MAVLRNLDAFAKPRDDLRTRSPLGGAITVVAASAASILFLAQVILYLVGSTRHSLHLSDSNWMPVPRLDTVFKGNTLIPLKVHVTFPHVQCNDLDVTHDSASMLNGQLAKIHGKKSIKLRPPTRAEMASTLGFKEANNEAKKACTVEGTLQIPRVGGTFSITVSRRAWSEATAHALFGMFGRQMPQKDKGQNLFNVSHNIHSITFGEPFPLQTDPFKNHVHIIENESGGVALSHNNVKLIPTLYKRFLSYRQTYQVSVAEHTVQPQTLMAQGSAHLPGLALAYDFTPLAVHHVEARDNIFVFISSLVGIVGGVFVTVGLFTGCLVHSAAAVAKKKD